MSDPYDRIVYIVQLDVATYLDPAPEDSLGRTTVLSFACLYHSDRAAKMALTRARKYRPFPNAKIIPMRLTLEEIK